VIVCAGTLRTPYARDDGAGRRRNASAAVSPMELEHRSAANRCPVRRNPESGLTDGSSRWRTGDDSRFFTERRPDTAWGHWPISTLWRVSPVIACPLTTDTRSPQPYAIGRDTPWHRFQLPRTLADARS